MTSGRDFVGSHHQETLFSKLVHSRGKRERESQLQNTARSHHGKANLCAVTLALRAEYSILQWNTCKPQLAHQQITLPNPTGRWAFSWEWNERHLPHDMQKSRPPEDYRSSWFLGEQGCLLMSSYKKRRRYASLWSNLSGPNHSNILYGTITW